MNYDWRCLLPEWIETVKIFRGLKLPSDVMFTLCQEQLWTAWPDGLAF